VQYALIQDANLHPFHDQVADARVATSARVTTVSELFKAEHFELLAEGDEVREKAVEMPLAAEM
jgi:hypothetical protein